VCFLEEVYRNNIHEKTGIISDCIQTGFAPVTPLAAYRRKVADHDLPERDFVGSRTFEIFDMPRSRQGEVKPRFLLRGRLAKQTPMQSINRPVGVSSASKPSAASLD
jgi:hypothetical protein